MMSKWVEIAQIAAGLASLTVYVWLVAFSYSTWRNVAHETRIHHMDRNVFLLRIARGYVRSDAILLAASFLLFVMSLWAHWRLVTGATVIVQHTSPLPLLRFLCSGLLLLKGILEYADRVYILRRHES